LGISLEGRWLHNADTLIYICRLSEIQLPPGVLEGYLGPVYKGQQPLIRITCLTATGKRQSCADGYERVEALSAEVAGYWLAWTERRLVTPPDQLPLSQDALAYRSPYLLERNVGRLKGHFWP
jgi:hypothetical protein